MVGLVKIMIWVQIIELHPVSAVVAEIGGHGLKFQDHAQVINPGAVYPSFRPVTTREGVELYD